MGASGVGWTWPRETCPVCGRRYPFGDPSERTGVRCFDCYEKEAGGAMTSPTTAITFTLADETEVRDLVDKIRREMTALRRKVAVLEAERDRLAKRQKANDLAWEALEAFLEQERYHCRGSEESIIMRQSILDKMRELAVEVAR